MGSFCDILTSVGGNWQLTLQYRGGIEESGGFGALYAWLHAPSVIPADRMLCQSVRAP